jgi:hypothetical protein
MMGAIGLYSFPTCIREKCQGLRETTEYAVAGVFTKILLAAIPHPKRKVKMIRMTELQCRRQDGMALPLHWRTYVARQLSHREDA